MECYICKKRISGRYYIDAFNRNACEEHLTRDTVQCSSCGGFTKRDNPLADGRWLCRVCVEMALKPGAPVERYVSHVLDVLKRTGFDGLSLSNMTVEIVPAQKLAEFYGSTVVNVQNKGACRTMTTMSLLGGRQCTHSIYMLTHLNHVEFSGALAHEMLHAWLCQNDVVMSPKRTEGFCNLGADLMWNRISSSLTKIYLKNLHESPDPIYGDGFREMHALCDELGWKALIAKVKNKEFS